MIDYQEYVACALRHFRLGVLVAWIPLGVAALHAQEFGAPAMDLVPVERNDVGAVPSGLESNLKALLETTRRVRDRLNQPDAPTPRAPESDVISVPRPSFIPSLSPNESDAPEQVNDLRDRIRLLRRLRSKSAETRPMARTPPIPSTLIPQMPAITPPIAEPNVAPTQPTLSAIEESLEDKQPVPDSMAPQSDVISATQVLSTPVDHLSLGESLYQTQNYPAALKALQAVKAEDLSLSDRTWLELLTALCYRRLGDTDTAAAQFREISNAKIADRSVPIARWLLKQTELVQNAQPALDAVSVELDSLIERSKTHVQ